MRKLVALIAAASFVSPIPMNGEKMITIDGVTTDGRGQVGQSDTISTVEWFELANTTPY